MEAKEILEKVRNGEISVEAAEKFFRQKPFDDMGFAKLDTHRKIRTGFGEVVFCSGKRMSTCSRFSGNWRKRKAMCWGPGPAGNNMN